MPPLLEFPLLVERSGNAEYPVRILNGEGYGMDLREADAVRIFFELGDLLGLEPGNA